ncbi:YbjN domain-containing protein [Psychrobacter sp. ANT_WB68]|uniref:YbjN domain-containing protein n=1 Tax=Psychrobacter sp. ANT_WB68 TaxID=2597355 RepID=UPI0011F33E85|nr:YbjN domain-containing protein [Psychrobacter sp. ANT_WB68]KAA0915061.1 hypothetical protein FQ084_00360 [Psychrobacter sp. ANT_WB68]
MSQSYKLSLWQRIKQLLNISAVQTVIDDIKMAKDLDSELDLTAQDKNNLNRSQDETDITETYPQDNDGYHDDDDIDISGSNLDLNHSFDNNLYNSLNSNLDSTLDNDVDTDAYFDNDIEGMTKQDSANDTPIVNYLKQYFDEQQWHYNHYRPKSSGNKSHDSQQSHHLSLRMRNKKLDCGYLFRVQEKNNLLAVYGILPFLIPESHQSAAMLLITQINYDMLIGNLEMDINDGEIRYKNAIDIEAVGIDENTIEHLLQSVIAMTTVAYEIFSDLVNNQNPTEELPDLLMALHQQEDSRTFFLPTQFVQ